MVPYCPTCSAPIGAAAPLATSRNRAQTHSVITGHVVQLADAVSWQTLETVAGEPGLPFRDDPPRD